MAEFLRRFARDQRGAAAAEMALVTPMLLILMFGSFELGKYFLDEHIVAKAVRDGARYAARQSFTSYAGCTPSSTVIDNTRNVTRTGQVTTGGDPRLSYWTNGVATISVTVACSTTNQGGSVTYEGIYRLNPGGAPVVTVAASVPYEPLIANFGFTTTGLAVNARSQATVNGI